MTDNLTIPVDDGPMGIVNHDSCTFQTGPPTGGVNL